MIIHGDSLEVLRTLDANSVDAVVTDPPYGLKFMGKKWDYDVPKTELWTQVFRILKPGGHLLSFGGTRTYHRMVVAIEDAGFEIRDQIAWLYGSGFPKSLDVSKALDKHANATRKVIGAKKDISHLERGDSNFKTQSRHHGDTSLFDNGKAKARLLTAPATDSAKRWQGWGTALKPANEPIVLARKPLEKGLTVAENVLKWGTGAINVDGARIGTDGGTAKGTFPNEKSKNAYGNGLNGACEIVDLNKGRWPANVLLDETAAEMLDEQSIAGGIHSAGKPRDKIIDKQKYNASSYHVGGEHNMRRLDDGDKIGASRFFYVAKASKRERNRGLEGMPGKQVSHMITGSGKPSESVKERAAEGEPNRFTATHSNFHPTVKPIKLMEYLCKLITPPGGTVLDPFAGSGSTGVAAKRLGFEFIGIEREEEYCEIARRRIEHAEQSA